MMETFTGRYGATTTAVTAAELAAASDRVDTKFGTREWLERVP